MTTHLSEYFTPQQLTGCRLVASTNVSGTYFNGLNNTGLGATITIAGSTLSVDGVACVNGDYVLLIGQSIPSQNGIYIVTGVGSVVVLTRRADFQEPSQMVPGYYIPIAAGSNAGSIYTVIAPQALAVGVSSIVFASATGNSSVTSVNLVNSGLNIYNPAETFLNHIVPTSAITADRQFSLITGDQDTSLNLTAVPNLAPTAYGETLVSTSTKFGALTALGIKYGLVGPTNVTTTTFTFSIPGLVSTDVVLVSMVSSTNNAFPIGISPGAGSLTLTFNVAPGASTNFTFVGYATV